MGISIQDLDALLGYDPQSHSVGGFPAIRPGGNPASASLTKPVPTGIPLVAGAPDVRPPMSAPSIPSIPGTQSSVSPSGQSFATIPDLKKPETGWQKFGHALEGVGEGIGNTFAPEVMQSIPGTRLNKEWEQRREAGLARTGAETELEKAQAEKLRHPTPTTEFEAWEQKNPNAPLSDWVKLEQSGKPDTEFTAWEKQNPNAPISEYFKAEQTGKAPTAEQDKQFMGQAEQNLADGKINDADRKKLAGMQREQKLTGIAPEIVSQIGQPPVPADYPGGDKDPQYIAANKKWGQAGESLKNQEAGAMGMARGQGYNASKPVQVLVPQPDGSVSPVWMPAAAAEEEGYAIAGPGSKAVSQQAQFGDINSAIQKVGDALEKVGNSAFTPSQNAKLTLAMQENDPTVMRNEVANFAASELTPAQQDLVTWLEQINERAMSLRNIAGFGQGSEQIRGAILKALPGLTSGNVQMAQKQLGALQNMVDNLHRGILSVKGSTAEGGNVGEGVGGGNSIPSFGDWQASQRKK